MGWFSRRAVYNPPYNERKRRQHAADEAESAAYHVMRKYGRSSPEYKRARAIARRAQDAIP